MISVHESETDVKVNLDEETHKYLTQVYQKISNDYEATHKSIQEKCRKLDPLARQMKALLTCLNMGTKPTAATALKSPPQMNMDDSESDSDVDMAFSAMSTPG